MRHIEYIDIDQARDALAQIGIRLTRRQMKRAADRNANGVRKLPFFIDPIDGKLKIEKNTLVSIYTTRQLEAEKVSADLSPSFKNSIYPPPHL